MIVGRTGVAYGTSARTEADAAKNPTSETMRQLLHHIGSGMTPSRPC
jgi:hypothetical protein